MREATQPGAEPSIQERILATIQPEKPEQPEGAATPTPEPLNQPAEEPAAETPKEDAPEVAEPQINLSDLALALGIDENLVDLSEDGHLVLKTKVDGEESFAKLQDLLKSHQLERHLNKQNMEVTEQRKKVEQERQQFLKDSSTRLQQMNDTLNLLHANLNAEFQGVDWNDLKREDPNEYVRKRMDFEDRQRQIQAAFGHLNSQREAQLKEIRNEQMNLLLDKIPEWRDETKFKAAQTDLTTGLDYYGFPKEEIGQILDHRFFLLAKDAMAYRKLMEKTPSITNKVRTAPKIVKSGQSTPAISKVAALAKLRDNIKKGKEGSVSEYLLKSGLAKVKP